MELAELMGEKPKTEETPPTDFPFSKNAETKDIIQSQQQNIFVQFQIHVFHGDLVEIH